MARWHIRPLLVASIAPLLFGFAPQCGISLARGQAVQAGGGQGTGGEPGKTVLTGALNAISETNRLGRPFEKHTVKLLANETYSIFVRSTAFDTYLTLSLDGKILATDDDGGGNLNSKIIYRATRTGDFTLEVSSFNRKLGKYELTIQPTKESPKAVVPKTGPGPSNPKTGPGSATFSTEIAGEILTPANQEQVTRGTFRTPVPNLPGRPVLKKEIRHPINLKAGVTYTFRIQKSHFAPEMVLIEPNGRTVMADNADSETAFAILQVRAPVSGRFMIGVRSADPGTYDLQYRIGARKKQENDLLRARADAKWSRLQTGRGDYTQAKKLMSKAVATYREAFPVAEYPQGYPDLARLLTELGHIEAATGEITAGLNHCEEGLAMFDTSVKGRGGRLAIRYQAYCVTASSRAYRAVGDMFKSASLVTKTLAMRRALPVENRSEAALVLELASNSEYLGNYREALAFYKIAAGLLNIPEVSREAAFERGHVMACLGRMWAKLGEPQFALEQLGGGLKKMSDTSLPRLETVQAALALADLQDSIGADTKDTDFRAHAATVARRLFPQDEYSNGHPVLATALQAQGLADLRAGKASALDVLVESHAMFSKYYSGEKFPNGHVDLARSADLVGMAYVSAGNHAKGMQHVQAALAMREKLFKTDISKRGHPDLVTSYTNASLLHAAGNPTEALALAKKGWAFRNELARKFLLETSEATALAYLSGPVRSRDIVLSLTADDPARDDAVYAELWRDKGLFTRLLERRREILRISRANPKDSTTANTWKKLQEVRQQIHVFNFHDDEFAGDRVAKLKDLTTLKESLEVQLAGDSTVREMLKTPDESSWQDLAKCLPTGAVFLDFVRYQKVQKTDFGPAHYAVFIVPARGRVLRVELGEARPIDDTIVRWRRAIENGETSLAYIKDRGIKRVEPRTTDKESVARLLNERLWKPIAAKLPAETKLIWVAPEGDLVRMPFAALPNEKGDGVLLESYAILQAPHGPFLVKHLTAPVGVKTPDQSLLTVGGVEYGDGWTFLKGAQREVEQINALAGKQLLQTLAGKEATPERLARELPKARIAHLATHGYFAEDLLAEERGRLDKHLKSWKFRGNAGAGPAVLGVRHPLTYTGLVLAGATSKNTEGILTAEAIVDLPLENMQLAVLSACETGLGEFTQGEGVQGLPRAFHIAGCANLVVSLWKVNDTATAALMTKFYHELLVGKQTPLDALRSAQLTIYRRPDLIPHLAGERGRVEQEKALRIADSTASETDRAPTRLWAPFFLSGSGR